MPSKVGMLKRPYTRILPLGILAVILLSSFVPFWRTTYASNPSITLSPNSGTPFDQITVNGTGFTPGQTISVNLYYPGYSTSLSIDNGCTTVATDGTFQCNYFRIPNVSPNSYTVTASDTLPESASATFTVSSAPYTFSVTPTSGAAGSSMTITGGGTVGFYPGCTVPIYFGTVQIGTWNSLTGSFVVVATVPNVSPGTYAVYTEDCINDYGFASFTVTSGTTTTTATASLGDSLGVGDTFVPGSLAPLSDQVSVSDQFAQGATALLSDGLLIKDNLATPIMASLNDGLTVADKYVSPVTAYLNDSLSLGEKLSASLGISIMSTLVFSDPPGDILITTPSGGQVGCDASGNIVNTVGSSATVSACSPNEETVSITKPEAGQYIIQIYGASSGSLTVAVTSYDSSGNTLGTQSYTAPVTQGSSQTIYALITNMGNVTISNSIIPTPEFPFGQISMVAVTLLALGLFKLRKYSQRGS